MRGKPGRILFTMLLVLLVFGLGTKIVEASENDDMQQSDDVQEEVQNALLSEFDFSGIEKSLNRMFPQEKITFSEVVSALMSGNMEETIRIFLGFLGDQVFYEFNYNRQNLVYVLLVALTAAVFSNFAGAFKSRQISDISFYIMYMLLITLCLTSFRTSAVGLEEKLSMLVDFMRVLCPSYFLAVAFASGSVTSIFFIM